MNPGNESYQARFTESSRQTLGRDNSRTASVPACWGRHFMSVAAIGVKAPFPGFIEPELANTLFYAADGRMRSIARRRGLRRLTPTSLIGGDTGIGASVRMTS
jgi:hypothetical protein